MIFSHKKKQLNETVPSKANNIQFELLLIDVLIRMQLNCNLFDF